MMKQIQVVAAFALALSSVSLAQHAVQWRVQDGGNGHWYRDDPTTVAQTFTARNAAAVAVGGHMATITSQAEHAFVISVAFSGGSIGPNDVWPALGGFRIAGSTQWQWVTGESFTYAPFSPDPPQYDVTQWLMMWGQGTTPLQWWTGNGNPTLTRAIIEWSADCNGDGIVDYGQCRDGSLPDFNGNNVPDCCESGTPCVAGNYPVQWRAAEGGSGRWYAVRVLETDCWDQARAFATGTGGYLATLTSASENQFVAGLLRRYAGSNVAIGGFKNLSSGLWQWVTSEPWQYSNWASGEPGCCLPSEWWLDINASTGNWRDRVQCIDPPPPFAGLMVTEWSADCNNDGIVDKGQILLGQLQDNNADGIPDVCQPATCIDADFFRDFNVNGADLGILLSQWGPNTALTVSDLNRDGVVDGGDLGIFLGFWGPCP